MVIVRPFTLCVAQVTIFDGLEVEALAGIHARSPAKAATSWGTTVHFIWTKWAPHPY